MKGFRVVADSSCLIALAQIDKFELLRDLFVEMYIPHAVYDEVVVKGEGEAGSDKTGAAIKDGWLLRKTVIDKVIDQLKDFGFRISDNLSDFE